MSKKAEWQKRNFKTNPFPPEHDYVTFEELTLPDGSVIARIEQFTANDHCFYANTADERSGCLGSYQWAKQWCETKTGNKVN
jgi:hypothetical protein